MGRAKLKKKKKVITIGYLFANHFWTEIFIKMATNHLFWPTYMALLSEISW